jgi:hypothetical protein
MAAMGTFIRVFILALMPLSALSAEVALDNDYLRVTRDGATCASPATRECVNRVIIALTPLEFMTAAEHKKMARGDIAVFGPGESHEIPKGGSFLEVVIKPGHPPATSPSEVIAPDKNVLLYDGADFFVFEERLAVAGTRARHSHSDRLVLQLNRTLLRQWPDGMPGKVVETIPDRPLFSPAVTHVVSNIGELPLRGIIIEFKRQK